MAACIVAGNGGTLGLTKSFQASRVLFTGLASAIRCKWNPGCFAAELEESRVSWTGGRCSRRCGDPAVVLQGIGMARFSEVRAAARVLTTWFSPAGLRSGPARKQSNGPSEPGAFQPPRKPVIADKRRPLGGDRR